MKKSFLAELKRMGPDNPREACSLAEARSYCRRLATTHYENFTVASWLLPRRLLKHFHAVYAYCRWADDLGDETGGGPTALALLRWWREELLHCYSGRPRHPIMLALRETIRTFAIPPEPFLNLLFAFEQDQLVKQYQTFTQLAGYCKHSANPVGRLVLYLCSAFSEARAELSDHICTGLQLANFWQDVARDLEIGRIYLPTEDRQRFGVSEADLQARTCTPAFVDLLRFEVDRTRALFLRGAPLLDQLPSDIRLDIDLFLQGGLAILRKIEAQGFDVLTSRPKLSKFDKLALVGGAVWRRWRGRVR